MCLRLDSVIENLYISGLTDEPFFGDGPYAMPDVTNNEIAEIEQNVMQAVACGASQGDVMDSEADSPQGDAIDTNVIYTDGDVYDAEDSSEDDLRDGEASEISSQGKKLQVNWNMHDNLLTTY
jgi:hypothetical protein